MAAPVLTAITAPLPARAAAPDAGALVIAVAGTGLATATALQIERSGQTTIVGTAPAFTATTGQATFDADAVAVTGLWNVRAINPDGTSAVSVTILLYQLSVRERISRNIKTTLEGITLAADYPVQIYEVRRAAVSGWDLKNFPACVVGEPSEETSLQLIGGTKYKKVMKITIEAWIQARGELGPEAHLIQAAIEKALMVDHTRGGYALDTRLTGCRVFAVDSQEPLGGVEMDVDVTYRQDFFNPFSN